MLRDAENLNEYAFAIGALAHYAADINGHRLAVNRAVPILYPKLGAKYGQEVTYADDPGAHLKTEFGFDVLQLAKGRYVSDAYRDLIGFEVSKPVLERAFKDTYCLELKDVFASVDLSIGSYRRAVSSFVPTATKIAWDLKKDEIQKNTPGITRDKFLYKKIPRSEYEKNWGKEYKEPGFGTHVVAFLMRIVPKIGPFRALKFRTPTAETEKLFLESIKETIETHRALLEAESKGNPRLINDNLDVGRKTVFGAYAISDKAYAQFVDKLADRKFAGISQALRNDILAFYDARLAGGKHSKESAKLLAEIEQLKNLDVRTTGVR